MARWTRKSAVALLASAVCATSAAAGYGSVQASPGLRVYIDGRAGNIEFTTRLPLKLASRLRSGQLVSREAGTAIAVLPFSGAPTAFAMVTLQDGGPRTYVNEVERLPVVPGLDRTMALDIPAYGVSLMTFVSGMPPGRVLKDFCSRLVAQRWARLSTADDARSTGVARLTKAGRALEIRVSSGARGSLGTIWLNFSQSR